MFDSTMPQQTAIGKAQNSCNFNKFVIFSLVFLLLSVLLFISAPVSARYRSSICNKVTKATAKACINDVKDNFWIIVGNCVNTEDRQHSHECKKLTNLQLLEEKALCKAQKKSRNEICDALGGGAYQPEIDPELFLSPDEISANPNPYFPLIPGMIKKFESGNEIVTVTVTEETIDIQGVTCIVVRDIVEEDGVVIEDTVDWYSQDIEGNVWYFGEIAKNFEEGLLSNLEGSWKAGVDNAHAGIVMLAAPKVGDIYRQEFALGAAEDMAEIISTTETSESSQAADCSATCLVTREFLPLEPNVEELKYYTPGIGNILVVDQSNGDREELIQIIMP